LIRGIVFDLFDTLVDQNHDRLAPVEVEGKRLGATTPALHERARDQFGVDLPILEFARQMRASDKSLVADTIDVGIELSTVDRFSAFATSLGLSDVPGFAQAMTDVHMGALHRACSTPAHHEAVLIALGVDYRMGICSNFTHAKTARAILSDADLDPHLSAILISEEVGIRKPRREMFEAVLREMECAPNEILHVGDNLVADVQGAAEIGMRTVWVTRQVKDPDAAMASYDGPPPDFALEDLMDLPVLAARLSV